MVDIKFDDQGELRVIGFRNETVKNEIQKIIWEMKHLKFPPEWEDVEQLMFDQNKVIERQIKQGSPEWQKIEANFRLTL